MNDVLQHRLEELKFRHYSYTHPVDFDPVPLGTEINTPDSEYLPAFNANGSVMVYTKRKSSEFLSNPSTRGQQEDLYISYIDNDNNFSKGIPLEELNTRLNEGAHSFSQDGKILIFTACDRPQSFGGCDLYISFKKNNNWSEPQNMGDVINTRHWESQPCLSADNKTLYFSSTRSGGYGKADIWKVNLENGKWSDAVNLGPLINTKGNEESPFIHPDNETIYFRSDHHIGLGDFDLFLSRLSNDEWTIPVNLGYPINSKGSEGALYVDLNGQKAYYATDKFTEQKNLDILYFKLPEQLRPQKVSYMTLRVRESDSFLPLAAKVELIDLQGIRENKLYKTDQKGELLTVLNTGEYALNVSMPGFLFHSENILIDEQKTIQKPFVFDIVLHRIKKSTIAQDNQPVTLENIFFESGSDKLLSKSNVELKILEDLLKTNPAINIQIIGHTDNVGSSDDNMLLSENRAKAIYNALISRGISNSRLLYIGMGETQPIDNNDTELGRQNNRRTEFIIIN
jgi:outer membrane protein OmpA-like peptidoglycan-associated protein